MVWTNQYLYTPCLVALNSKEPLLFATVLDALRHEGDTAYSDTILHLLITETANHIESILNAGNLTYIIDTFFMVSYEEIDLQGWLKKETTHKVTFSMVHLVNSPLAWELYPYRRR